MESMSAYHGSARVRYRVDTSAGWNTRLRPRSHHLSSQPRFNVVDDRSSINDPHPLDAHAIVMMRRSNGARPHHDRRRWQYSRGSHVAAIATPLLLVRSFGNGDGDGKRPTK